MTLLIKQIIKVVDILYLSYKIYLTPWLSDLDIVSGEWRLNMNPS